MNKRKVNPEVAKQIVRCAIYTRKSSEEGLQQDFNTLDAQRESGEAFIAAHKGEGWVRIPERYDDGGFTGGNLDRPAMQRLSMLSTRWEHHRWYWVWIPERLEGGPTPAEGSGILSRRSARG